MTASRISVAGIGHMGHRFVQAIRRRGLEIGALFDPAEAPFAITAEPDLAARHVRDLDVFLRTPADAVVVATTADQHVPLLRRLIEAGHRRIIVEKPFSQSHVEALEMQDLARRRGVRVIVNHGRRYCANTARLKALDGSRETGRLRAVFIRVGGGALGCVGTHWIDLADNLFGGKPESVFAVLSHETPANNRGARFDDPGGTALLCYSQGRRAVIDSGDDVGIVAGAEFVYERAQVAWQAEGGRWVMRRRQEKDFDRPLTFYGLPLEEHDFATVPPDIVEYASSTLNDVLSDGDPISGIDRAVETMEVFAALRWSARDARPIVLPVSSEASQAVYPIP